MNLKANRKERNTARASLLALTLFERTHTKMPIRKLVAARLWLLCTLFLAALLCSSGAQGTETVTVPCKPTQAELAKARKALQNGSVVAMLDATPRAFSGGLHIAMPQSKESRQRPVRYKILAAYRAANGAIHTYTGPRSSSRSGKRSNWYDDFEDWAEKQGNLQDSNSPDAAAWTALSVSTMTETSSNGNMIMETLSVYRANSSNTETDYYMITQKVDSQPDYHGCMAGAHCGWYSVSRNLTIQTDIPPSSGYSLFDHGPTQTNGSSTGEFTIGAGVSGLSPNVSASYTQEWTTQDVTTIDNTDLTTNVASWNDQFSSAWIVDGNPPAAVKGLWESDEGVVYAVPVGTASFNVEVNDQANFHNSTNFDEYSESVPIDTFVPVQPPSLSVSPTSLNVLPGQQITFNISAYIPASTGDNLSWTISNIPSTLNLNTTTGAGNQTIAFNVPSNATPGLLGTLNIDTSPVYASPETRTGPLQLPITVVTGAVSPGVLITGGTIWNSVEISNSAEVWNPDTQTSKQVGNMIDGRTFHTATGIADSQIFVAGGINQTFNPTNTTEIYNEATQQFTAGPNLNEARAGQTATLLNDGTVLLVGGYDANNTALSSAEIYDPVSNTIAQTGSMSVGRVYHTATLLPDSRVLISGGSGSASGSCPSFNSSEIYNPQTRTFTPSASTLFATGLMHHAATLLTNGQVLVGGGNDCHGGASDWPIIYMPATDEFTLGVENLEAYANDPALVALPNGNAVIIGGGGLSSANSWIFDSAQDKYVSLNFMQEQRDWPQALLLHNTNSALDGDILVAGGVEVATGASNGQRIEVYNPATNTWSSAGNTTVARSGNTATLFGPVNVAAGKVKKSK
jgi:Galactose oxidase, central domain